jgi:DNA-binding FrmR family transcriptional regulator
MQFIQNCHTVVQQIFDVTTLRKMQNVIFLIKKNKKPSCVKKKKENKKTQTQIQRRR